MYALRERRITRSLAVAILVAVAAVLLAMSTKADAASHEDTFCWGRTITPSSPCNAFESELEAIHKWVFAVHVRGVEHSVCVKDVFSGQKACSGGPSQDAWLILPPSGQRVWPVIYPNNGVKSATTVYGWVHYQDPPESGGGGGETPPPPPPPPPAPPLYRYMLGTSNGAGIASWYSILSSVDQPVPLRVGDLTGDGRDDAIAVESEGNGKYNYMLGVSNGAGFSEWNQILSGMSQPLGTAVGDWTGDGKDDIVVAEASSSSSYRIMLGISNGAGISSWSQIGNISGISSPAGWGVGDWTGDGKADLVVAESTGSNYRIMLGASNGAGLGTWNQIGSISGISSPAWWRVGDVSGDGKADVVAVENSGGSYRYMLGKSNGAGLATWNAILTGMSNPSATSVGDVTGDGKADVVSAEPEGSGKFRYMFGTSNGSGIASWNNVLSGVSQPVASMSVGDLTGDGKADIVAPEQQ